MRTSAMRIRIAGCAKIVAARLVESSAWFEFEPLPDDAYEFRVKEENGRLLGTIMSEAAEATNDVADAADASDRFLATQPGPDFDPRLGQFTDDPDNAPYIDRRTGRFYGKDGQVIAIFPGLPISSRDWMIFIPIAEDGDPIKAEEHWNEMERLYRAK